MAEGFFYQSKGFTKEKSQKVNIFFVQSFVVTKIISIFALGFFIKLGFS